MSSGPGPDRPVHPDFDGHLERPIESMSPEERARWAVEFMELLHWARQVRESASANPPRQS